MAFILPNFGKFRTTQHVLVNRLPSRTDEKCSTYWKTFIHAVKNIMAFPEAIFTELPTPLKHILRRFPALNFSQNSRQIWRVRAEIHLLPSVKCDCNSQFSRNSRLLDNFLKIRHNEVHKKNRKKVYSVALHNERTKQLVHTHTYIQGYFFTS